MRPGGRRCWLMTCTLPAGRAAACWTASTALARLPLCATCCTSFPPPRRQLTTLNELNQTLKGQLHNVTSGLETIIHSARAHQAPNGAAAHQAPNGAHHTNGNGARPPAGAGGVLLQPPPQQQQQQPAAGGGVPSGGSDDGDSVLHTSTLSCVVQHPGALCCTKTTASSSPATMTCTVSLETTARWVWSVVCHMGAAGRQWVWGSGHGCGCTSTHGECKKAKKRLLLVRPCLPLPSSACLPAHAGLSPNGPGQPIICPAHFLGSGQAALFTWQAMKQRFQQDAWHLCRPQ